MKKLTLAIILYCIMLLYGYKNNKCILVVMIYLIKIRMTKKTFQNYIKLQKVAGVSFTNNTKIINHHLALA